MTLRRRKSTGSLALLLLLGSIAAPQAVPAHSASDAYLNLTATKASSENVAIVHGQWDIALRDLDFVLQLDDDGDGQLTWAEVRHHQEAIERYAFRYLTFDAGVGNPCTIRPGRAMIDEHADGAYAALFFDVTCAHAPAQLALRYTLFFAIDPSHRGIFVMSSGDNVATAVFSPDKTKVDLPLA